MSDKSPIGAVIDSLERRERRRWKQRQEVEDILVELRREGKEPHPSTVTRYADLVARHDEARLALNAAIDIWNREVAS